MSEELATLEQEVIAALEKATLAETAARAAFAKFYSGLGLGHTDAALPPEVAETLAQWVEARKHWELLAESHQEALRRKHSRRTGPRLALRPPNAVRLPTSLSAKDALAALFSPQLWQAEASGLAVTAQLNPSAQVRVELDDVLGFGQEQAIQQIARYGPSAAQTFLALATLWHERLGDQPHETYLSLFASDLLRFQGKKETPRGGYHREDLLAKGRDLYLLSRITIPHAEGGETFALGRLLSLEALEVAGEQEGAQSIVRFRYHLGREAHSWMSESAAQVAPRLLSYHPVRQKYQILLGFCLAWYASNHPEATQISLPTLLELAAIPMPQKRLAEFLTTLEDALNELSRDGIIAGAHLVKPLGWHELLASRQTREILNRATVSIPSVKEA